MTKDAQAGRPGESVKKRLVQRRYLWLGLLFCMTLFCFWWFGKGDDAARNMPQSAAPVRVARALKQDVPQFLDGLGTVTPSNDVLVRSRVGGQLMRLHFQEGQRVSAGDLLAEIDPRPFQAELDQARGTLARDKAQLENARRDLERYARLRHGDFIAGQQYESQRALVTQYEGTVKSDQAAVDSAILQLEYSRITAPLSGRLGLRSVDVGNQIQANDPEGIVRITETIPCDVVFTLPESQLGLITQALRERERNPETGPIIAQAWDREQKELLATGQLVSMDNQIDSATGTVRLKARFANTDEALYPNQFVNVRLLARTLINAITVPSAAVQLGANGSYCYVVETEEMRGEERAVARLRDIAPGIISGEIQVVEKGLEAGDLVVIDGLDRLRNGIPVRIAASIETPEAPADPGFEASSRFDN